MRGLRKIQKRSKGGRRFEASRDESALEATRSRPCLLRGKRCTIKRWVGVYPAIEERDVEYMHSCVGPVEAHHVITKARGGRDNQTVPLCTGAHSELHTMGQRHFEERWDVSLAVEQAKVWAAYKAKKASG